MIERTKTAREQLEAAIVGMPAGNHLRALIIETVKEEIAREREKLGIDKFEAEKEAWKIHTEGVRAALVEMEKEKYATEKR